MRQTDRPTQTNRCSSGKIRERKRLKEKKNYESTSKRNKTGMQDAAGRRRERNQQD